MAISPTQASRCDFRLADPERTIQNLMGLIEETEKALPNLTEIRDKRVICFLGNTGSGKSTLINYLAGCVMERFRDGSPYKIRVSEESPIRELVAIGNNERESETLIPALVSFEGRHCLDCPGFFDTRGEEINLANMVNMLKVLRSSHSIRVVLLINHYILLTEKARGLEETIKIAKKIFGSEGALIDSASSLLIGITHIKGKQEGEDQRDLKELKSLVRSGIGQPSQEVQRILDLFADRLFIYDPLDRDIETLEYSGKTTRRNLLEERIDRLQEIRNPLEIFKPHIEESEENFLHALSSALNEKVERCLHDGNFHDVSTLLSLALKFMVIEHPVVSQLILCCRQKVLDFLQSHRERIYLEIEQHPQNRDGIQRQLQQLEILIASLSSSDQMFFEQTFPLKKLKDEIRNHFIRLEGRIQLDRIGGQIKMLDQACTRQKFQKMVLLIQEIGRQCALLKCRYRDPQLIREAQLLQEEAKERFKCQAITILDGVNQLAKEERERNALHAKIEATKTQGEREKREWEEALQRQDEEIQRLRRQLGR